MVRPREAKTRAGLFGAVLVLGLAAPGVGLAAPEPVRGEVDAATAAAAMAGTPAACRAEVESALRAGRRPPEARCREATDRAAAELIEKARPRPAFGIVERETVRLHSVALVLSVAHHCERWPLRAAGEAALDVGAAKAASCRVRRYHGPLQIGVRAQGGAIEPVLTVRADLDGRVEVVFAEVDATLRARGRPGLTGAATLVVGAEAWAGEVELTTLRAQTADWHAAWISRGRGLPALFAPLHPEHPEAAAMRALALEAAIKRQAADAEAVRRGELSRRRFLARHAWSPFRTLVEANP